MLLLSHVLNVALPKGSATKSPFIGAMDVSRAVSPLVKAKDAHEIDTSHVTVEQVVTTHNPQA